MFEHSRDRLSNSLPDKIFDYVQESIWSVHPYLTLYRVTPCILSMDFLQNGPLFKTSCYRSFRLSGLRKDHLDRSLGAFTRWMRFYESSIPWPGSFLLNVETFLWRKFWPPTGSIWTKHEPRPAGTRFHRLGLTQSRNVNRPARMFT